MNICGVTIVVSVLLLSACGPPPINEALATYTLSGAVCEITPAGLVPIDGARVEETSTHLHATSDGGGFYSLYGLYARTSKFSTSKAGYVADKRDITIDRDTRLNIQLKRVLVSDSSFRGAIALPTQEAKQP